MHLHARHNAYARELGPVFDECPKAVIAAVAMSYYLNHDIGGADPVAEFCREWDTLYQQGVVPQRPGKHAKAAMRNMDGAPETEHEYATAN